MRNGAGAFVIVGVRTTLTKHDKKQLCTDKVNCYMDIWIPVKAIPGEGKVIALDKIDIRKAYSMAKIRKGSSVREIYLPQKRLACVAS
jgi:hypothetical protein